MPSRELKKIRELRRKLVSLNFEEIDAVIRSHRGEGVGQEAFGDIEQQRREIFDLLRVQETRYLIRKAESWGIEVPYKREWYYEEVANPIPDPSDPKDATYFEVREWLNSLGKAVIAKQIREARRASMKWWSDMLVPLMALAIAFLALFKDVIVAYIQASR